MRLAQWQDAFIDALSQGGSDDALLSLVNPAQASRLGIYRNNSLQALTATLSITFPISLQLVGEACFNQLAKTYIQSSPMVETNLNHYGSTFPAFLAEIIDTRMEFSKVAYLSDMAELEWSLQSSYYAPDSLDCLPISQISLLDEQQHRDVVLQLRPDVFVHHSVYPLFEIWLTHHQDIPAEGKLAEIESVEIEGVQADYFLSVCRDPFKPMVKPLSRQDHALLSAISAGISLGEMTDQSLDMARLPAWIAEGWICGFCLREAR